jgi:hypothetical protein
MYFLGHTHHYWLELQKHIEIQDNGEATGEISPERLLEEIANLRSRVRFYESRIKEMNHFSEQFE